MVRKLCL